MALSARLLGVKLQTLEFRPFGTIPNTLDTGHFLA
jgi:hypothetical protein